MAKPCFIGVHYFLKPHIQGSKLEAEKQYKIFFDLNLCIRENDSIFAPALMGKGIFELLRYWG